MQERDHPMLSVVKQMTAKQSISCNEESWRNGIFDTSRMECSIKSRQMVQNMSSQDFWSLMNASEYSDAWEGEPRQHLSRNLIIWLFCIMDLQCFVWSSSVTLHWALDCLFLAWSNFLLLNYPCNNSLFKGCLYNGL